jgi:hypothetical protein
MTGRRGYRRKRNNTSSIFPGINTTSYQGSNLYPYSPYINGTGGGYSNGSSTGASLFSMFRSKSIDDCTINCGNFKLKGKLGYLLLESFFGEVLMQIDYEGLYKYRFLEKSRYDLDEIGHLIILDEGYL